MWNEATICVNFPFFLFQFRIRQPWFEENTFIGGQSCVGRRRMASLKNYHNIVTRIAFQCRSEYEKTTTELGRTLQLNTGSSNRSKILLWMTHRIYQPVRSAPGRQSHKKPHRKIPSHGIFFWVHLFEASYLFVWYAQRGEFLFNISIVVYFSVECLYFAPAFNVFISLVWNRSKGSTVDCVENPLSAFLKCMSRRSELARSHLEFIAARLAFDKSGWTIFCDKNDSNTVKQPEFNPIPTKEEENCPAN